MSDHVKKWDKASKSFDKFTGGDKRRYGKFKRELFAKASGKIMLVAAGTGQDFILFPPGLDITAIDFSPKMLEKARERAALYNGSLKVAQADVQQLEYPEQTFDTVVTSCTFCSVPDPVKGFMEIHRVLKPDGKLLMFEHVRPQNFLLGLMMDISTTVAKRFGPEINRRTGENVRKAGFKLTREFNIYLDMVKLYEAVPV
ncbi:MAG: methyltransferase type 11 [bacterium]|nr:MAG: methyltransferase type 11 [bacterium]